MPTHTLCLWNDLRRLSLRRIQRHHSRRSRTTHHFCPRHLLSLFFQHERRQGGTGQHELTTLRDENAAGALAVVSSSYVATWKRTLQVTDLHFQTYLSLHGIVIGFDYGYVVALAYPLPRGSVNRTLKGFNAYQAFMFILSVDEFLLTIRVLTYRSSFIVAAVDTVLLVGLFTAVKRMLKGDGVELQFPTWCCGVQCLKLLPHPVTI